MFTIIGLLVVIGSVIAGYTMHHGKLAVLMQATEFIIIFGAAAGALIVGNPMRVVVRIFREMAGLLRANPYGAQAYAELLRVLYQVFQTARREGLVGLEPHIEQPETSELFARFPRFRRDRKAVALLCDTLKVLLSGTVEDHHLTDILDLDLEKQHDEAMAVPQALAKIGDAMPGFGIVAAVLGVVITMGSIGGSAVVIGQRVAAALVGTLLGVLLAYGVVGPIASAIEARVKAEAAYMGCIRTALLSFARGDAPMTSVEFARRNIEPAARPSFAELEGMTRRKAA